MCVGVYTLFLMQMDTADEMVCGTMCCFTLYYNILCCIILPIVLNDVNVHDNEA